MEARTGRIDRIVAGGSDGTVNEVFSTAFQKGLPKAVRWGYCLSVRPTTLLAA
jgi:diacylglycerol kinase family enzyme